mgnify:FL=1
MLTKIELENFKSFEGKHTIDINNLTTIIGLNSSGKTNILEGISILSNISSGIDITAFFNKYAEMAKGNIRGGASGCCRTRKKVFGLGCTIKKSNGNSLVYSLKIDVANEDRVYVDEENLYELTAEGGKHLLFKTIKKEKYKGDIVVEYDNKKRGKNPRIQCDRSYSILSQLDQKLILNNETLNEVQKLIDNSGVKDYIAVDFLKDLRTKNKNTIYQDIELIKENIKNVQSINPNPDKVRNYVSRDNSPIFTDASNLSAVLDRLISGYRMAERRYNGYGKNVNHEKNSLDLSYRERYEEYKKKYDMLLSIVRLLPEYEIKELSTIITPSPLRDVMFTCVEVHNGNDVKMPASLLSDGTIKVIAIATAIVTSPDNSVLLLDEFDSGTHQNKSFELLRKLFEVANERNIILVVTTHNTSLLNQYTVKYLKGTSIVFRTKETGNSEIVNFYDLKGVEKLLARGGLGDAALKDGLDEYLYTQENKEVALPEWLQNMGEGHNG